MSNGPVHEIPSMKDDPQDTIFNISYSDEEKTESLEENDVGRSEKGEESFCDSEINGEKSEESSPTITCDKNDGVSSTRSFLESLDLDVPSSYEVEPVDFPNSPFFSLPVQPNQCNVLSDEEEDKSIYQAQLLSNCQDVKLLKDNTVRNLGKKKVIPITNDIFLESRCDESSLDGSHTSADDPDLDAYLDSPDEIEDSIMERLGEEYVEPIPELSAEEEMREARSWKTCVIGGIERNIDLKVLEPYKRVVSHGGYLSQGSHNAIIVFSACFLPDRSRVDYDYVMKNLFMYVITTLDQLVTDDYVLIYLHGATSRSCMPKFNWLKQCYQMIDHKLRKNLKGLYLVHPTFWLKTLVVMTKPFISSKFSKKLFFIYSLNELYRTIPLEQASIPDRVKKFDGMKFGNAE
ncbi:UNVERIFIED_CONTAM: hypothetical protein PYX00_009937 [Menopon gallinae]|uniref:CRAL-TRIO domain-containing protein n=1 Tax=Menopon gallinae TaxID=328185 RepID=A0AAW2HDK7_9NEOP